MYNNDIRVVNTATPLVGETNVSQYGWTTSDRQAADQMVTYVTQCKEIYVTLEEKLSYVEELIKRLEAQLP